MSASSVWTGTWSSEFGLGTSGFQDYGRCTLVQSGDVVTGTSHFKYEGTQASGIGTYGWESKGSIEGTASGNRLTGVWQLVITSYENSEAVRTTESVADFVFVMSDDGTGFAGDINEKVVSDTQNSDIGDTFEYGMNYVLESTQPTSEPSLQVSIETDRLSNLYFSNEQCAWTIKITDQDSGGPVPDVMLRVTITDNLGTANTRDDKTNELGVSKWPFLWREEDAGTWNMEVVASKPGYQDGHGTGTVTVLAGSAPVGPSWTTMHPLETGLLTIAGGATILLGGVVAGVVNVGKVVVYASRLARKKVRRAVKLWKWLPGWIKWPVLMAVTPGPDDAAYAALAAIGAGGPYGPGPEVPSGQPEPHHTRVGMLDPPGRWVYK